MEKFIASERQLYETGAILFQNFLLFRYFDILLFCILHYSNAEMPVL